MQIRLAPKCTKYLRKQTKGVQESFERRILLFIADPFARELENHVLHGEFAGYRSINITGDIRAIYEPIGPVAKFIAIGTHHELYGS